MRVCASLKVESLKVSWFMVSGVDIHFFQLVIEHAMYIAYVVFMFKIPNLVYIGFVCRWTS